jgi:hypothetical protein
VRFDRTPPPHEKSGKPWGGYAGLSLRLVPHAAQWTLTNSAGAKGATAAFGKKALWMDVSGPAGGIAVFDSPRNLRHPTSWYSWQKNMPYISPAFLFNAPYVLSAGKSLTIDYRILVHTGSMDAVSLNAAWESYFRQP